MNIVIVVLLVVVVVVALPAVAMALWASARAQARARTKWRQTASFALVDATCWRAHPCHTSAQHEALCRLDEATEQVHLTALAVAAGVADVADLAAAEAELACCEALADQLRAA